MWAVGSAGAGVLAVAACSSFSGSDVSSSGAAAPEAGADSATDPCLAGPTAEAAGLYVMGGQSDYNGFTEPDEVLRATIQCDGRLRDWKPTVKLPRTSAGAAGGMIGDAAIYVGGQHSTGGANFTDDVVSAPFVGAVMQPFFPAGKAPNTFWRAMFGGNGASFFVAGGENNVDGGLNVQTAVTTWKVGVGGEPVIDGKPPQLPTGLSRGVGVMIGDTMIVIAGHVYTAKATDTSWRDTNVLYPDFDFAAATDGTYVFLVPGSNGPGPIVKFTVAGGAPSSITSTGQPGPAYLFGPTAVAFRGYLYIIGGLDSDAGPAGPAVNVYSARIKEGGNLEKLSLETPLPVGHILAVAFVR